MQPPSRVRSGGYSSTPCLVTFEAALLAAEGRQQQPHSLGKACSCSSLRMVTGQGSSDHQQPSDPRMCRGQNGNYNSKAAQTTSARQPKADRSGVNASCRCAEVADGQDGIHKKERQRASHNLPSDTVECMYNVWPWTQATTSVAHDVSRTSRDTDVAW